MYSNDLVSKMMCHCTDIVRVREESESGIRKWEDNSKWFKTTAEDGERGGSSDVRWKTVPETSGWQEMLSRRQWTDEYVERPENVERSRRHCSAVNDKLALI